MRLEIQPHFHEKWVELARLEIQPHFHEKWVWLARLEIQTHFHEKWVWLARLEIQTHFHEKWVWLARLEIQTHFHEKWVWLAKLDSFLACRGQKNQVTHLSINYYHAHERSYYTVVLLTPPPTKLSTYPYLTRLQDYTLLKREEEHNTLFSKFFHHIFEERERVGDVLCEPKNNLNLYVVCMLHPCRHWST